MNDFYLINNVPIAMTLDSKNYNRLLFYKRGCDDRLMVDINYHRGYRGTQDSYEVSPEDDGGSIHVAGYYNDSPSLVKVELATYDVPNSFRKYVNTNGGIKITIYSDHERSSIKEELMYPQRIRCLIDSNSLETVTILLKSYDIFDILGQKLPKDACNIIEAMRIKDITETFPRDKLTFPCSDIIISNGPTAGSRRLRKIFDDDINTPFKVSAKLFCWSEEETYDNSKLVRGILIKRYHDKY